MWIQFLLTNVFSSIDSMVDSEFVDTINYNTNFTTIYHSHGSIGMNESKRISRADKTTTMTQLDRGHIVFDGCSIRGGRLVTICYIGYITSVSLHY